MSPRCQVGADRQFRNLCKVLGVPELGVDDRFATNPARVVHRDALIPLLRARIADPSVCQTRADLMATLRANAVPVGGVNDMQAVFEQPPAEALVVRDDDTAGGKALGVRQVAYQRKGGAETAAELAKPPRYAQHTREVLGGRLGISDGELERLLAGGSVTAE